MSEIADKVRAVAIALAKEDNWSDYSTVTVQDGFTVPRWLLYVSRAQQLIHDRNAISAAGK